MFFGPSADLALTVAAIVTALASAGALLWLERRPRELGKPLLVPTTPLLFLCLLIVVVALAHLVSIVTGTPHTGRLG